MKEIFSQSENNKIKYSSVQYWPPQSTPVSSPFCTPETCARYTGSIYLTPYKT